MLAAPEFSVDYLRTNFLQLLVWGKYFKTEICDAHGLPFNVLSALETNLTIVRGFTKFRWTSVVVTEWIWNVKQWKVSLWHNSASILSRLRKSCKTWYINTEKWSLKCLCCEKESSTNYYSKQNELAFSQFCAWITDHSVPETYSWVDVCHFCNSIQGRLY